MYQPLIERRSSSERAPAPNPSESVDGETPSAGSDADDEVSESADGAGPSPGHLAPGASADTALRTAGHSPSTWAWMEGTVGTVGRARKRTNDRWDSCLMFLFCVGKVGTGAVVVPKDSKNKGV